MITSRTEWLHHAPISATNPKANTKLFPFLARLMRGEDFAFADAEAFFNVLTDFEANPAQIAGALVALTAKGETYEELAGMAKALRAQSLKITTTKKNFIDVAGTGSSSAKTFNVSTAVAFVVAGAGLAVAKQCNRAVSSDFGSADVLSKLGIKISGDPNAAQASFNGTELGFLFAPKFYPTLARVGDIRRNLGIRTCLNLLGVLSNPAGAPKQLIGVWHESLFEPMTNAVALLGTERSWVVHGTDGMDELTIAGDTFVSEIIGNRIRQFRIAPEDFGLKRGNTDAIKAKDVDESAAIIQEVLSSKRRDEARSIVVLNAAAALMIGGLAKEPIQAARLAERAIDSGQAQLKLERLVQTTNKK